MALRQKISGFGTPVGGARRSGRRSARLIGHVLSLGLALAVALFGVAVLRLSQGPIPLDDGLPRLMALAQAGLDDWARGDLPDGAIGRRLHVSAQGAYVGFGSGANPTPGLYVTGVAVGDSDGRTLAAIPEIRIGFRPLDLLAGRLRLTSVRIAGASLALTLDPATGLVGDITPSDETTPAPPLLAVLGTLIESPPPLLEDWRSLAFDDITATVGLGTDESLILRAASVRLTRRPGGIEALGTLPLPGLRQPLRLSATMTPDTGLRAEAVLAGARLPQLAALHPAAASLAGFDLPVDGTLRVVSDPDGALSTVSVSARLGAGLVPLVAEGPVIRVSGARLAAEIDAAEPGRILVREASLDSAAGSFSMSGEVDLAQPLADGFGGLVAALEFDAPSLPLDDPRRAPSPPLATFDRARLVARVTPDPWRVELAEAWLSRGSLDIAASGWLAQGAAGVWDGALDGWITKLSLPELQALWPPRVAPDAITWIREHLDAGLVEEASFHVRGPPADAQGEVVFAFRDARARPLLPLPPITGGAGRGRVTRDGFTLALDAGQVMLDARGGTIDLAGSSFVIDDFVNDRAPARITVQGHGPIPAMLDLIGREPLALTRQFDIRPQDVVGNAAVTVELSLPLLLDLPLDAVAVTARAALADVRLVVPDLPLPVVAQRLDLVADTAALRLTGEVRLGGSALALTWDETFARRPSDPRTVVSAEGTLQRGDAATLGLSLDGPAATLARPLPLTLRLVRGLQGMSPSATRVEAEANLTAVALAVPELGFAKPAGRAGTLRLSAVAEAGALSVERFVADAQGLRVAGRARLDNGRLARVDFETLRLGPSTALSGSVQRLGEGFEATLRGTALDARPLIEAVETGATVDAAAVPVDLRFEFDRLLLADEVVVTAAKGSVLRRDNGILVAALDGRIGGAELSGALDRDRSGAGTLRLRSGDAGALLRGADLFPRALGGRLELTATLSPDGTRGEARIDEVIVSDDPTLDGLLRGADLEAALERLRAEGIRFTSVRAPFLWRDGLLQLSDAVAVGPVIGLTLSGDYDLRRDRLAMEGVFTPLYGLNSLIGRVPLVGPLLTGGEGQGLIAFTFRLTGPAADPQTTVNPLSVLFPGFLRMILRPGSGQAAVSDAVGPDPRSRD